MKRWALCTGSGVVVLIACGISMRHADAQRFDPRRANTQVVGEPEGPGTTSRGDGRRTGTTRFPLPSENLRLVWRKTLGTPLDQPALAGPNRTLAVVTATRGDVIFISESGDEAGRLNAGVGAAGPATMISDGTVVFLGAGGDAVGVVRGAPRPRFLSRIGNARPPRVAPLPLHDGGVVLATSTELVVLDAEGNPRARTIVAEPLLGPLLAAGERVIATSASGNVYGWVPGREFVRVGSFGAALDGGAALVFPNTLIGVTEGNQLVEVDWRTGARTTRSALLDGLFLGPASVHQDAQSHASRTTLLAYTASRAFVVTQDASGQELVRVPVETVTKAPLADGGVAPLSAPSHVGPLVDGGGTIAFATPDGHVGVVSPSGHVDLVSELLCTATPRSSGIVGLTSLGRGAFAVTCEGGVIAKVAGSEAP